MSKLILNPILVAALLTAGTALTLAQQPTPLLTQPADKLIAVLQAPDASQKDKADACRELAVLGTKDAVPALVALLPDEKMNHMARYALETIPDSSVDEAFRDALGKLKGRPLVGVIGSIGVRHDAKAVQPLTGLLQDADGDVVQAAARALGKIGGPVAVQALLNALPTARAANQLALSEGLFRCAEALLAKGDRKQVLAIYDKLRDTPGLPHQVRAGATRGAILARGNNGLALLKESLASSDYILFAAAVRTAMEMTGPEAGKALIAALPQLPPENQVLVMSALARRRDFAALQALSSIASKGDKTARIAAVRAIAELSKPATLPVLLGFIGDADREIAQAAQEGLASIAGPEADGAVMNMFNGADAKQRLTAIDLMARRRMTTCVPVLLKAANDADPQIHPAALKRLGELAGPTDLPALLDVLSQAKASPDLEAAEQALGAICAKADKPEACADKLIASLAQAQPAQKSALVRVLGSVGGAAALKAVRAAVDDPNADVHATAIRTLGSWKTADAAPDLLALARNATDANDKTLCLRSYLGLAANPDLPAEQRLGMCRQGIALVGSADEKKMLLAALGSIRSPDAEALIKPYLEDSTVTEEAKAALQQAQGKGRRN